MRICRVKLVTELAKRNMTGQDLAKQARLSKATVSSIKNGRSCSEDTAAKIAGVLNMAVEDFKEVGYAVE